MIAGAIKGRNAMNENNFKAKRYTVSHQVTIKAAPDDAFALACPVEELKWIRNWQFEMVYSKSGHNELNCIFEGDISGLLVLNTPGLSTVWQTTRYDRSSGQFHALLIWGEKATGNFEFQVDDNSDGTTKAQWQLTYTALNAEGNKLADEALNDRLFGMVSFLAECAKHYLETGEML